MTKHYAYLFDGLGPKRLAVTAVICVLVTALTVWFVDNRFFDLLISALCVGITIMLSVTVAGNLRQSWMARETVQIIAVIPAAILGTLITGAVKGRNVVQMLTDETRLWGVLATAGMGIGFGAVITLMYINRERAARVQNALLRADAEKQRLEKQILEARLQLMQAQIEPHFLFNTLANVQHLVTTDSPAAARMLENLIRYLRVALPQMRDNASTVGREMDMTAAYLEIFRMRMGAERLAYEIRVPNDLRNLPFPPMILATLVENAIKHGIDPLCCAGTVVLNAEAKDDKLLVSVSDTGQGMLPTSASGIGLTNIRERLATLYGKTARLHLAENQPNGVVATIELPLEDVTVVQAG